MSQLISSIPGLTASFYLYFNWMGPPSVLSWALEWKTDGTYDPRHYLHMRMIIDDGG